VNLACTSQLKGFTLGCISLLLCLAAIGPASAADHVEIRIRLQTTWASPTVTNEYEGTAICVLGTNDWYISGEFLKNARVEYWLTGTNVLERKMITSNMYGQRAKDFISETLGDGKRRVVGSYPAKGESYTKVRPWIEPFGYGTERAVWLGFCSGTFLRIPNRQVPLPLGHSSEARGFEDETVYHDDDKFHVSPPKSVVLLSTNKAVVCRYEVVTSTNIFGRILPTEFRVVQYGITGNQTIAGSKSTLVGKLESVRPCQRPSLPDKKSSGSE